MSDRLLRDQRLRIELGQEQVRGARSSLERVATTLCAVLSLTTNPLQGASNGNAPSGKVTEALWADFGEAERAYLDARRALAEARTLKDAPEADGQPVEGPLTPPATRAQPAPESAQEAKSGDVEANPAPMTLAELQERLRAKLPKVTARVREIMAGDECPVEAAQACLAYDLVTEEASAALWRALKTPRHHRKAAHALRKGLGPIRKDEDALVKAARERVNAAIQAAKTALEAEAAKSATRKHPKAQKGARRE